MQDIYNTIPSPSEIKLFDQSKIDGAVREIATIMATPDQVEKYNIDRNGGIKLQFDITRHQLNSAEKERLRKVFENSGWVATVRNGEMTDQGSTYLTLTER